MSIALLLIPLGLLMLGFAVWAFFWAVDNDQFEDLEVAGRLALEEDPAAPALPKSPR